MVKIFNAKQTLAIASFGLLLVSGSLLAQSANPETPGASQDAIEEVAVIATRVAVPVKDLPGNISVLDAQNLEHRGANHIQQALSQIPGVNYQRGNGQESLPAIRSAVLTGAGACGNVLVLEEAIAVRGAGFCNVNELFDTHYEQAERIEVVRGANTAFYGSNAMLGSINVGLAAFGPNQFSMELGSNSYRRAKAALSYGEFEQAHGRLYLTLTEDGGFRDDSGYKQQKFSWRHSTVLGDWDVKIGATATHLDQQTAGFIVGLDSYRDKQLARQNLDPEAFRKTSSLRAWASFDKAISDSKTLTIAPYLRVSDMDFLQHFLPGDPLEQNQQQGIGWQSNLNIQWAENLSVSLGIDAELANGELLQTQDQATQGSTFLRVTIPAGTHYDYQVDSKQLAGFAHVDWQANDKLKVLAGLRLEYLNYDYDNLALTGRTRDDGTTCGFGGCRYSRPADRKDSFTHLSPKLEVQYSPNANWRWHLALSDAFRAPQATELYRLQRAQLVADLDKVRATHIDAGLRWQTEQTQLALSVYQIKQSNVIIRDSSFFNIDGQRIDSQGIELAAKHAFNADWSLRVAATYANHEYGSEQLLGDINIQGNDVDTAPRRIANVALQWQVSDKFSNELEMQHSSDYFMDPENLHSYPGHTVLNWRGHYQVNDDWSGSLRVLNLGDKRYAERADFTSFTDERYFPGEPRSVFAELRVQF